MTFEEELRDILTAERINEDPPDLGALRDAAHVRRRRQHRLLAGLGLVIAVLAGAVTYGVVARTSEEEVITAPSTVGSAEPSTESIALAWADEVSTRSSQVVVPERMVVLGDDALALQWSSACNAPAERVDLAYGDTEVTVTLWVGYFFVVDCVGEPDGPWSTVIPLREGLGERAVVSRDAAGNRHTVASEERDVQMTSYVEDGSTDSLPTSVMPGTGTPWNGTDHVELRWFSPRGECWPPGTVRVFTTEALWIPSVALSSRGPVESCSPSSRASAQPIPAANVGNRHLFGGE